MVFFIAPALAKIYKNPILLVPLQCIGLIVPFSAVVGAFRGIFQGVYKMQYILVSRGVEQIMMILSSILLIILGFSVVGALLGTVIGFFCSLISVIFILHRYFFDIYNGILKLELGFKEEIKIAYKIISFSIPVILTAISEIGIYREMQKFSAAPAATGPDDTGQPGRRTEYRAARTRKTFRE